MTPVERQAAAKQTYQRHAAGCPHCEPTPDPCRATRGCDRGRRLANAYAGAWRRRVDAMSGGEA